MYLRYNDVHLPSKFTQSIHQLVRVSMDAHPATINKNFGSSENTVAILTYPMNFRNQ